MVPSRQVGGTDADNDPQSGQRILPLLSVSLTVMVPLLYAASILTSSVPSVQDNGATPDDVFVHLIGEAVPAGEMLMPRLAEKPSDEVVTFLMVSSTRTCETFQRFPDSLTVSIPVSPLKVRESSSKNGTVSGSIAAKVTPLISCSSVDMVTSSAPSGMENVTVPSITGCGGQFTAAGRSPDAENRLALTAVLAFKAGR